MIYIARDFNTPTNHIGEMVAYLFKDSNQNKIIAVDILNLHGMGQACILSKIMYVIICENYL